MTYPANPTTLGGNTNFNFDDPLPYILTSQLIIGEELRGRHRRPDDLRQQPALHRSGRDRQVGRAAPGSRWSTTPRASTSAAARTSTSSTPTRTSSSTPRTPATRPRRRATREVLFTSLYDYDATTPLIPTQDQLGQRHDAPQRRDGEPARPDEFGRVEPGETVRRHRRPDRPLGERRHPVGCGRRRSTTPSSATAAARSTARMGPSPHSRCSPSSPLET